MQSPKCVLLRFRFLLKMCTYKSCDYGWFRETINTISGNNKFYSPPGGLYKNSLVKTINTEYIKINKTTKIQFLHNIYSIFPMYEKKNDRSSKVHT